jgi:hypothetical protein
MDEQQRKMGKKRNAGRFLEKNFPPKPPTSVKSQAKPRAVISKPKSVHAAKRNRKQAKSLAQEIRESAARILTGKSARGYIRLSDLQAQLEKKLGRRLRTEYLIYELIGDFDVFSESSTLYAAIKPAYK